jgi:hypothetical protein
VPHVRRKQQQRRSANHTSICGTTGGAGGPVVDHTIAAVSGSTNCR